MTIKYPRLFIVFCLLLTSFKSYGAEYILVLENKTGIFNVVKFEDDGLSYEDKDCSTIKHHVPKNEVKGLLCIDREECAQDIEKNKDRANHILKILTNQKLIEEVRKTIAFLNEAEIQTQNGMTYYNGKWHTQEEFSRIKRKESATEHKMAVDDILRKSFYRFDREWIKLPAMDLSKPSSQTESFEEFHRDFKAGIEENRRRKRDWEQNKELHESRIDSYEIGSFGRMTVDVIQIIDLDDMIVDVEYIKNNGYVHEQLWIHGYSTETLSENSRVTFEKAAIIGTKTYETKREKMKTVLLVVPADQVQNGLSDIDIIELREYLVSLEEERKELKRKCAELANEQERERFAKYKIGDTVRVGYFSYVVEGAKWLDHISSNPYQDKKPNAHWMGLFIMVRNDDRESRTIQPFQLVDRQGRVYDSSPVCLDEDTFGALDRLNPDVTQKGYVLFDVPDDRIYRLKVSGGFATGIEDYIALVKSE